MRRRTDPRSGTRIEQRFRAVMAEAGSRILEPQWLGERVEHRVICKVGHETVVRPKNVTYRGAPCPMCSQRPPGAAEQRFRDHVTAQGGTVLEPTWRGVMEPHGIRCPQGHETEVRPADVARRRNMCRVCTGRDPQDAARKFREAVADAGGTLLDTEWRGNKATYRVRCAAGHEGPVRWGEVRASGNICTVCTNRSPAEAERRFRERVAELGGRVVEPEWLGNKVQHRILCPAGHETKVRPNNVDQGDGLGCRFCVGKVWDAFYVIADEQGGRVKFGITSTAVKRRVAWHRWDGMTGTVVRGIEGLPDAPELERAVIGALRLAGLQPIRGREYFEIAALPLILDIVDNWPK